MFCLRFSAELQQHHEPKVLSVVGNVTCQDCQEACLPAQPRHGHCFAQDDPLVINGLRLIISRDDDAVCLFSQYIEPPKIYPKRISIIVISEQFLAPSCQKVNGLDLVWV